MDTGHSPPKQPPAKPMSPAIPSSSFKSHISPYIPVSMPGSTQSISVLDRVGLSPRSEPAINVTAEALRSLTLEKVSSEKSLSAMTSPEVRQGVSMTADRPMDQLKSGNEIFVTSQKADDVFDDDSMVIAPQEESKSVADTTEESKVDHKLMTPTAKKIVPRADRIGSPITPANAQGVLPPEACVFVANLAMHRSDEQLEASCHEAFDIFGQNVIKVRRDRHKHPFALVQYYDIEDATRAIRGAHNLVVDGRRIRTEHAQARRAAVLTKVGGGCPTVQEAKDLLEKYGPIKQVHPTTHADALQYGCPEGMWVEFAYYDDFKDALRLFNTSMHNSVYDLAVPQEIELPRFRPTSFSSPKYYSNRSPRSSTDQKSIFLGNLPANTTETELQELFSQYGEIKAVNVIHKPIQGGTGFNVFGFIEFANPYEAEEAASKEVDVRGQRIRVEPKEYSARRNTRLGHSLPSGPYPGPGRIPYYNVYPPGGHHYTPPHGGASFHASPSYTLPHGFTPFHQHQPYGHHHHQGSFGENPFATPPPSSRIGRRSDMFFSGSPHGVPVFSPVHITSAFSGMDRINETEYESPHRMM